MIIKNSFVIIALTLFLIGCSKRINEDKDPVVIDHHFEIVEHIINSFRSQIFSVYQWGDRFHFVKCKEWLRKEYLGTADTDSTREIQVSLNDTIFGKPDHHFQTYYILSKIMEDSLEFSYFHKSNHPGNIRNTIEQGKFRIKFENQKVEIGSIVVDGTKLDSTSASKHISAGKYYFLIPKSIVSSIGNGERTRGICRTRIADKYSFEDYELLDCIVFWNDSKLIDQYNEEVYQAIKVKKNIESKNYLAFRKLFELEVYACQQELSK